MRLKNLVIGETMLLYKYGIVLLYCIFSIVYLCLLSVLPEAAREITTGILIFTDPSAMGLFFMGAMVLFEKSQRVESSLGVSPIKIREYIIAKTIPFLLIGVLVSMILCWYVRMPNVLLVWIGVMLSSTLFSLCGLWVGSNIRTLNSFIIATVPFEILIGGPAILYPFHFLNSDLWILHPGVAAIRLIFGETKFWGVSILSLMIWTVPVWILCKKAVRKSFSSMGGAKL